MYSIVSVLWIDRKEVSVHHFLPVDQVVRFGDKIHERRNAVGPAVEDCVDIVGPRRLEVHDSVQAVHLGRDRLVGHEVRQELFSILDGQVEQVGHPLERDARVILGHYADVVLDDAVLQYLPVLPALLRVAIEHDRGRARVVATSQHLLVLLA